MHVTQWAEKSSTVSLFKVLKGGPWSYQDKWAVFCAHSGPVYSQDCQYFKGLFASHPFRHANFNTRVRYFGKLMTTPIWPGLNNAIIFYSLFGIEGGDKYLMHIPTVIRNSPSQLRSLFCSATVRSLGLRAKIFLLKEVNAAGPSIMFEPIIDRDPLIHDLVFGVCGVNDLVSEVEKTLYIDKLSKIDVDIGLFVRGVYKKIFKLKHIREMHISYKLHLLSLTTLYSTQLSDSSIIECVERTANIRPLADVLHIIRTELCDMAMAQQQWYGA